MPMMGRQRARPSLNQLVAQNRPLPPPRPVGQLVGTPKALPGLIPYGPEVHGPEQSTRFTGGQVPGGAMSLTHPEAPPTFQEPQFPQGASSALGPVHALPPPSSVIPVLAAAALTGALGSGGAAGGGGTPPPPPFIGAGGTAPPSASPDRALAPLYSSPVPYIGAGGAAVPTGRSVAAPGTVAPLTSLAALLANPAVGKRGAYSF